MNSTINDANLIGHYLLNQEPSHFAITLYGIAIQKHHVLLDSQDQKLWNFMIRHPWAIGWIDSGLALLKPHSAVRQRVFVMLAILECLPEYYNLFTPQGTSYFHTLLILPAALSALGKALLGCCLVKVIG